MFGLGTSELVIILLLVLVVFGAGKLSSIGGALGKGIRNFKDGIGEVSETKKEEKEEEKKKEEDR
jgi:sec-independent protein translocase protein TatA